MSRDVPYRPHETRQSCGRKGVFDFTGDLIRPDCTPKVIEEDEEYDEIN